MGGLEQEWKTEKYFNDEWLALIQRHQSDIIYGPGVASFKNWFEYVFNPVEPEKSTYRCRLCMKYFDLFVEKDQYRSALADPEGILRETKKKNGAALREHNISKGHLKVIEKLKERQMFEQMIVKRESMGEDFYNQ